MIQGFLLGLAVNIGCLTVCSPILFPFFLSENKKPFLPVLKFMLGRLIAYLFFASFFGTAGLYFNGRINPKIFSVFGIMLSLWLILYALGKLKLNFQACRVTGRYFSGVNFPFFAGIVLGLNICPPFLLGLNRILEMGSLVQSIVFFLGFYIGSSVWLAIFMFNKLLARNQYIRYSAQILSAIVGLWYLTKSILVIIE
jgi:hypothetical protein